MFEVLDLATDQALCAAMPVMPVGKGRSGFLICHCRGKGRRTCAVAVLRCTQSLEPELGWGC